jgi:hypothetical protein
MFGMVSDKKFVSVSWYFVNWRLIGYPIILLVAVSSFFLSLDTADQALRVRDNNAKTYERVIRSLDSAMALKRMYSGYLPKIQSIDAGVAGTAANRFNELESRMALSIKSGDYVTAGRVLGDIKIEVDKVLNQQEVLANEEVVRLEEVLEENLRLVGLSLGSVDVVPSDYKQQLSDEAVSVMDRVRLARGYVKNSQQEIERRREVMSRVKKSIVVEKSAMRLTLYEDGIPIYEMPVSVGRYGHATKTGEYYIMNKKGTVRSYWGFWLPYWMGIYYAGSSENGIHGLPFDNGGREFWESSIGRENITMGCVMPDNPEIEKLYYWSDIGTPITIVD